MVRLSIDYPIDFLLASYAANSLYETYGLNFTTKRMIAFIEANQDLFRLNKDLHPDRFGE